MRNEMRNFLWKLIIFQCLSTGLYAQKAQVSSLSEKDSITIYTLKNQAFSLKKTKPDSALLLAKQALVLSEKYNHLPSQVSLLQTKGLVYQHLKQYEEALKFNNEALKIGRQINYRIDTLLNMLGNVHFLLKDYPKAVVQYEETLAYAKEKKDTIKQIDALHNLGNMMTNSNQYEQAFDYYLKSLTLQRTKKFSEKKLTSIRQITWLYLEKIDMNHGISIFEKGVALAKKRKDWKSVATFYRFLGLGYQKKGLHDKCLEAFQQELYIRENFEKDLSKVLATKTRIALLDIAEDDLDNALNYSKKGLQIAIENEDAIGKANFKRMMALVYLQQGHCDTAITYFRQEAGTQFRQLNFSVWTTSALHGIENCLEKIDHLDSAVVYLNHNSTNTANPKWTFVQARIAATLGKVYLKQSKYQLAKKQLEKSIELAQKGNLPEAELDATWVLYQILVQQKEYQAAYAQLEKHQKLQKTLFDEDRIKNVARLKAKYDFEQEKQALFQKNELEKRALDEQIRQQKIWILFTSLGLSFSLLLGYLVYRFQRLKRESAIEQEKLRTDLQEQERIRLEEMDTFKSKLFTNISHELRTPLSIIMGMNEKINENPEEWSGKGTKLIRKNANQLLNLTNQILEIQKLESQSVIPNYIQGDVVIYLKYLLSSFESIAENKQLQLTFETSPSEIIMDYDAEKLEWIVSNLLSNAIKFTPKNGKVRLNLQSADKQLLLQVIDTGIGIPEEKKTKVFDRYYQIENDTNLNGSGIGLSLVKELVQLLKGDIAVESKIDGGSTFSVRLPITQNAPIKEGLILHNNTSNNQDTAKQTYLSDNGQEKATLPQLLIVEDNLDMIKFLETCLTGLYQIQIANNGQEGIEKAIETIPDIIISDVMMPLKDGYELCDTLKKMEQTSHIPIILLTAKVDTNAKLSGLEKGADVYLNKPFNEKELKIRLDKLLQLRKQLQQKYAQASIPIIEQEIEPTIEDLFLQKINTFVKDRMAHPDFDLGVLCQHLHMSRSQVFRKVKALTGKSPSFYIRSIRLTTAKELIESTSLTMAEIAYQVGFTSTSYFSKTFYEAYKVRPSEVRK